MSVILGLDFLPAQTAARGRPGRRPPASSGAAHRRVRQRRPHRAGARGARGPTSTPSTTSRSPAARPSRRSSCASSSARSRRSTPRSPRASAPRTAPRSSSDVLAGELGERRPRHAARRSTRSAGTAVRAEAARVLDTVERSRAPRQRGRARSATASRAGSPATSPPPRRALGAALIRAARRRPTPRSPPTLTEQAEDRAAEAVEDVMKSWERGETIVRSGDRVDDVAWEAIEYFTPQRGRPRRRPAGRVRRAVGARDRPAADLDVAVPARVLAPQQRAAAAQPAAAVRRVRAQAHGGPRRGCPTRCRWPRSGCSSPSCSTRASRWCMTALIAMLAAGGQRGRPRARRVRAARRDRGHRRRPARRPAGVFVQAGHRACSSSRRSVVAHVRAARRPGHPRASSSCSARRRSSAGGAAVATVGSFAVLGSVFGILTVVPAARAREPVAAAAPPAARRDAGHVPPLA